MVFQAKIHKSWLGEPYLCLSTLFMPMPTLLEKWRLILGGPADPGQEAPLEGDFAGIDRTLEALYDSDPSRRGGLGASSPSVNRWLGDIRRYFPTPVVQMLQRDALERLNLQRMLLEPELLETVVPDVHLVGALLSLNKVLPTQSRETARMVVAKLVKEVEKRLKLPLQQAVAGSLRRVARTRRPRPGDIDWRATIRKNLRHYQPEYQTIIPADLIGFRRDQRRLRHVILLLDQSGSMASSVVYAGILGCILASINSLRTHVVAFDTEVADLSAHLSDPVDLLFATQLGGGTHIAKALAYAEGLVTAPRETILILISDLFEGAPRSDMMQRAAQLHAGGVKCIVLLALNDEGAPAYDHDNAAQLAALGIPAFAATPDAFPEIIARLIEAQRQ